MLFHSFDFVLLMLALAIVYPWIAKRVTTRNLVLLAISYLFYGWWDPRFLGLLWISSIVDFLVARSLAKQVPSSRRASRKRKWLLAISITSNLGILAAFKYAGFFVESAAELLGTIGVSANLPVLNIILPVGISFYTFQTLGYTIDVYRGKQTACPSFLQFALYVAFFPQLVAGPIERSTVLLPQLAKPSHVRSLDLTIAAWWISLGYFKKIFIADNLAGSVDPVFADPAFSSGAVHWLAAIGFAFQIYADFSGYSDIARGVARAMGFRLSVNFCLPYFASSPREFWRRWHITLSSWLRDYVYIALGGSRHGRWSTARNLMLTMLLGGLWHGAAWTFVLWGFFHGCLLVAEHFWRSKFGENPKPFMSSWSTIGKMIQISAMFFLTLIGWIIFRSPDLATMNSMIFCLPIGDVSESLRWVAKLCVYVAPLLILEAWMQRTGDQLIVLKQRFWVQALILTSMLMAIVTLGYHGETSFIYFQF